MRRLKIYDLILALVILFAVLFAYNNANAQEVAGPPGDCPANAWAVAYQYPPETGMLHHRSDYRPWSEWRDGTVISDSVTSAVVTVKEISIYWIAVSVDNEAYPKPSVYYLERVGDTCLWSSPLINVNGAPFHVDFGREASKPELYRRGD